MALCLLRFGEKSQVTSRAVGSTPRGQGAARRHRVITKAEIKANHVPSTNRSEIYWAKDHRSLSRDGPVDTTRPRPNSNLLSSMTSSHATAHLAPTSRDLIDIAAKEIPLSSLHNACRPGRRPSHSRSPECQPCLALGIFHRTNSLSHQRARPRPTNFSANHPSSPPRQPAATAAPLMT